MVSLALCVIITDYPLTFDNIGQGIFIPMWLIRRCPYLPYLNLSGVALLIVNLALYAKESISYLTSLAFTVGMIHQLKVHSLIEGSGIPYQYLAVRRFCSKAFASSVVSKGIFRYHQLNASIIAFL